MKHFKFIIICISFCCLNYLGAEKQITEEQKKAIAALTQNFNKASDFTLKNIEGGTVTLSELKGKVVLLNFWATWCGPCRMEIPEFNELFLEHQEEDFLILGITIDGTKRALKNFLKAYTMEYPVLYESARKMNQVSDNYGGIMALPTSILIGRNGDIIRTYPGALLKAYSPELYAAFVYDVKNALAVKIEIPNSETPEEN